MADLASTDVTLTRLVKHRVGLLKQRIHQVAFGDGALTYPSGGVPLPALSYFELAHVDFFDLKPVTINGLTYKYDKANHKVRIFQAAGFTPAGSVAAPVFTGAGVTPVFTGAGVTPVFTGAAAVFGESVYAYSLQNLKGADADVATSETVDEAALPTNSAFIDAAAAVAVGAWAYTENAEIPNSRNVNIVLLNDTGGDIVMEEGELSFLVTGLFRGAAQTDTITFTFAAGTKTIGHGPNYRWKYGVKPFDQVSSVVATGLTATQNGLKISVGLGRLLGVPVEPDAGSINNFIKITKNSAELAPVAYNDTNKTLDVGALADNDDLDIEVEVASIGESYTPAGTIGEITPAGTIGEITPAGTNSAPAFTGNAVAAAALAELGNVAVAATVLLLKLEAK